MNAVWRSTALLLRCTHKPWRILPTATTPKARAFLTAQMSSLAQPPVSLSSTTTDDTTTASEVLEAEQEQSRSSNNTPPGKPLPDLPPPVRGWPTFWIIKRDVDEYLYPLYDRGWGIKFAPRKNYFISHDRYVAHLRTEYTFANFNCAYQFLTDVVEIANKEKHHPSLISLRNTTTRPTLAIMIQTHTALRPRWNEEDPSADSPLSRRVPGITRRDIRLAILLEQTYDTYQRSGKALETRGSKMESLYNTPSWEYLVSRFVRCSLNTAVPKEWVEKQEKDSWLGIIEANTEEGTEEDEDTVPTERRSILYPRQKKREATVSTERSPVRSTTECLACRGPHDIRDCTVRDQHKPSTLCYVCLEPHWWLDCPQRGSLIGPSTWSNGRDAAFPSS